jgi:hypothetical protein
VRGTVTCTTSPAGPVLPVSTATSSPTVAPESSSRLKVMTPAGGGCTIETDTLIADSAKCTGATRKSDAKTLWM